MPFGDLLLDLPAQPLSRRAPSSHSCLPKTRSGLGHGEHVALDLVDPLGKLVEGAGLGQDGWPRWRRPTWPSRFRGRGRHADQVLKDATSKEPLVPPPARTNTVGPVGGGATLARFFHRALGG